METHPFDRYIAQAAAAAAHKFDPPRSDTELSQMRAHARCELRTTIATAALNGLLAGGEYKPSTEDELAIDAVRLADALLKELDS